MSNTVLTLAAAYLLHLVLTGGIAVAGEITVSAQTPVVTIETRAAGRNFIQLPTLEYAFTVELRCRPDLAPDAFSLSIADTRVSMSAEYIPAGAPVEITVRVPANQIAPVAVEGFCMAEESESAQRQMLADSVSIPSVLSVQASLLCTNESNSEMTYASQPVDVTLNCNQATDEEVPGAEVISRKAL